MPSTSVVAADIASEPLTLGVLEDVPGVFAGEPPSFQVRVAFQKNGADWTAFPSNCLDQQCLQTSPSKYPAEVTWNVTFAGRILGQVRARTPQAFHFYSHAGLQAIISTGTIPTVGERTLDYAGWPEKPVYRPLVTTSSQYVKDPESWKPEELTPVDIDLLRRQFRKSFPRLCKADSHDETKLETLHYRDTDVTVSKTYRSKRGWRLARLHVSKAIDCEDTERGWEINDRWFALSPKKSGQYIGEGIVLVDAGDYDGSGRDVLVFSIDRYNEGGYELFYGDFRKHAVFSYTYH